MEIQDRFELFTMLTSNIDEMDFNKLLFFFQSLVTFQELNKLITGKVIKRELDDYIGTSGISLPLNNNTRMRILIDALLNQTPHNNLNVTEKVKQKIRTDYTQFCSNIDQVKDAADDLIRVKEVMDLLSIMVAATRNSKQIDSHFHGTFLSQNNDKCS